MSDQTFELVWMQRLGGGCEVLRRGIPAADALKVLEQADRDDHGPGGVVLLRPDGETGATAELSARLDAAAADAAELRRLAIALRNVGMRLAAPGSEQWRTILQEGKAIETALYAAAERGSAGLALLTQLHRAEGLATAATIALYELTESGGVQAHTRSLLQAAVDAFEAGSKEASYGSNDLRYGGM
jgi:hypothetical protein